MKIYLAGMEERRKIKLAREHGIKYWMVSLASLNDHAGNKLDEIIRLKPDDVKLALDNGFFSIQNEIQQHEQQMDNWSLDWEGFVERYIELLEKNGRHKELSFYPVIDPPYIEGREQSEKALEWMRIKELDPVPVWHLGWGRDYLQELVEEYDYICVGGVASKGDTRKQKEELISRLKYCKENKVKTHLFGVTSPEYLRVVKDLIYSADSTSWTYGPRAGQIFLSGEQYTGFFTAKKLEDMREYNEFYVVSNYELDKHNIEVWKHIQDHFDGQEVVNDDV